MDGDIYERLPANLDTNFCHTVDSATTKYSQLFTADPTFENIVAIKNLLWLSKNVCGRSI